MVSKVMYSSEKHDWETPDGLFQRLHAEFGFVLDVCATRKNAKLPAFWSPEDDGLSQYWAIRGPNWCNPPYGREIGKWVAKAAHERTRGATTVMLIPARTDTKWYHEYIYEKEGVETRFLKGRLKFKGAKNSAPFPSMIVVFRATKDAPVD